MRALSWFVRIILFLLLFGLALNNLSPTVVHLLFGTQVQAPLFMLLLLTFVLGIATGALAMLPALLRARRQRPQASGEAPRAAAAVDENVDGV